MLRPHIPLRQPVQALRPMHAPRLQGPLRLGRRSPRRLLRLVDSHAPRRGLARAHARRATPLCMPRGRRPDGLPTRVVRGSEGAGKGVCGEAGGRPGAPAAPKNNIIKKVDLEDPERDDVWVGRVLAWWMAVARGFVHVREKLAWTCREPGLSL